MRIHTRARASPWKLPGSLEELKGLMFGLTGLAHCAMNLWLVSYLLVAPVSILDSCTFDALQVVLHGS